MEAIICCLFGVFVGMVTAGHMYAKKCTRKENIIEEQREENLQVCGENKDLRAEVEDLTEDLSTAYKEIELKDKQIEFIKTILEQNSYKRDDIKIAKLKELVADWKAN